MFIDCFAVADVADVLSADLSCFLSPIGSTGPYSPQRLPRRGEPFLPLPALCRFINTCFLSPIPPASLSHRSSVIFPLSSSIHHPLSSSLHHPPSIILPPSSLHCPPIILPPSSSLHHPPPSSSIVLPPSPLHHPPSLMLPPSPYLHHPLSSSL